jgi:hypothetical protein
MKFTTKEPTYEDIIHIIPEASLISRYIGADINKPFKSLFRKDPKPSGRFYYNSAGRLYYNDFIVHLSTSDLLMRLFHIGYKDLINKIIQDFNITTDRLVSYHTNTKLKEQYTERIKRLKKKDTVIDVHERAWNELDKEYWGQGGISIDFLNLPEVDIKPIDWFWINKSGVSHSYKADELAYVYNFYWHLDTYRRKIYQPNRQHTEGKWFSNINHTVLQGVETLPKQGEILIISSSFKDSLVIENNTLDARMFIPSCAPNNEMANLPEHIPSKFNRRFKRILTWFDQDDAGHLAASKYKQQYGYDSIFIPEGFGKDPYAFRAKYGHYEFIKLIQYLLYERCI